MACSDKRSAILPHAYCPESLVEKAWRHTVKKGFARKFLPEKDMLRFPLRSRVLINTLQIPNSLPL